MLLAEVYAAGEAPIVAADGRALARALRVAGQGRPGVRRRHRRACRRPSPTQARDGDVVIAMGAGSIGSSAAHVVELLESGSMNIDAEERSARSRC